MFGHAAAPRATRPGVKPTPGPHRQTNPKVGLHDMVNHNMLNGRGDLQVGLAGAEFE